MRENISSIAPVTMQVLKQINYKMYNILVTSAGKRVSLLNAFKKELKAIFPDEKVLQQILSQLSPLA
jgi:hypothetical protein